MSKDRSTSSVRKSVYPGMIKPFAKQKRLAREKGLNDPRELNSEKQMRFFIFLVVTFLVSYLLFRNFYFV